MVLDNHYMVCRLLVITSYARKQSCGVCGTDLHIHEGEFIAEFPLIPGHETTGVVVGMVLELKL